ncbi:ABC transporter permease [Diplocloster agilis]|uniref:ABC transporter permease n=1 Tax=Diplocloster agilis TaxID=2850323 RepID=A0A949NGF3_9FIRM|nr:ABC transporter permease [Diplocloster agilis]MBU9736413.1 ABC transporter permease [Diplocloster agilis]
MQEILLAVISPVVFAGAVRIAAPLVIGSVGGCFTEKSGTFVLAYECFMLISAFFATWGSYVTGSAVLGALIAVMVSILVGILFGILVFRFQANGMIVSIALIYGAWAVTTLLLVSIFQVRGSFISPDIISFQTISIPFLNQVPVLNDVLNNKIGPVYLAFLLTGAAYVVMYKTPFGLRLRGVGMNATAAQTAGTNIRRYKWTALIIMCACCGLGGAIIPLSGVSMFTENMTSGRGFLCLAAVLVGGGNPIKTSIVAFLFAYTDALYLTLTSFGLPTQLLSCIPYVAVIFVLIVSKLRARRKAALGAGRLKWRKKVTA